MAGSYDYPYQFQEMIIEMRRQICVSSLSVFTLVVCIVLLRINPSPRLVAPPSLSSLLV